jgi:hypothetical protein
MGDTGWGVRSRATGEVRIPRGSGRGGVIGRAGPDTEGRTMDTGRGIGCRTGGLKTL